MPNIMKVFVLFLFFVSIATFANSDVKVKTLGAGDPEFIELNEEFSKEGIVKKIISSESRTGFYYFVFVEKPIKKEIFKGNEVTTYGLNTEGKWGEIKVDKEDDMIIEINNLRAYIMRSDHGGYVRVQKFQDDGNEVYWPEFFYDDSFIDDADGDGNPEFYLTYYGESDGLDSKPLKVIVYDSTQRVDDGFLKAKATAFYPAGNEEDAYRVKYDSEWSSLPEKIQLRALAIISKHKM